MSDHPMSKKQKRELRDLIAESRVSEPETGSMTDDAGIDVLELVPTPSSLGVSDFDVDVLTTPVDSSALAGSSVGMDILGPSSIVSGHQRVQSFASTSMMEHLPSHSHVLTDQATEWTELVSTSTVLREDPAGSIEESPSAAHHLNIPLQTTDTASTVRDILEPSCTTAHPTSNTFHDILPPNVVPLRVGSSTAMDISYFLITPPSDDDYMAIKAPPLPLMENLSISDEGQNASYTQAQDEGAPKDLPLFEGSPLSVHDSMVSILTFAQSAHLSGKSIADLLSLLELLLPKPNNLINSFHSFKKYFQDSDGELNFFYFCSNCFKSRSSLHDLCDSCSAATRKVTYFISCPLGPQLQRLYSRPGFCEQLQYKYTRKKTHPENIEDILDGTVYKEAEQNFLNDGSISLTWYSDGISIFECSTYSLWPCLFSINELAPDRRYNQEDVLVGGLWGGDTKPHPNIFLLPMYHEVKKLNDGVGVQPFNSTDTLTVHGYLIYGVCGTPAKSGFMCMKGHSGYFCCPKCYIKGEKSERSSNVMVFPHEENLVLRHDQDYEDSVEKGIKCIDGFKGVYGPSMLFYMFSLSLCLHGYCETTFKTMV